MVEHSIRAQQIHNSIKALIHVARMHHRNMDRIGTEAGLNRSPCMLLLRLAEKGELNAQRELATHFDISPACIARSIKSLSQDGLIEREESAEDTRRNRIAITDEGLARANAIGHAFDAFDTRAFEDFSDEELDLFKNMLTRVETNIRKIEVEINAEGSVAP